MRRGRDKDEGRWAGMRRGDALKLIRFRLLPPSLPIAHRFAKGRRGGLCPCSRGLGGHFDGRDGLMSGVELGLGWLEVS